MYKELLMNEPRLHPTRKTVIYLLVIVNGVLGLSVLLGVGLPWFTSSLTSIVSVIIILLFVTIFCVRGSPISIRSQQVILTLVSAGYLLTLLIYPYTFEMNTHALPWSYGKAVLPLCFWVLTFGYLVITGRHPSILGMMASGAIAIFFTQWWIAPDRFIEDFETLALYTVAGISIGGAIAWLLKE